MEARGWCQESSSVLHLSFLGVGFLTEPGADSLEWLPASPRDSPASASPVLDYRHRGLRSVFDAGAVGLNSSPYVCIASTLPTEPCSSPWPSVRNYWRLGSPSPPFFSGLFETKSHCGTLADLELNREPPAFWCTKIKDVCYHLKRGPMMKMMTILDKLNALYLKLFWFPSSKPGIGATPVTPALRFEWRTMSLRLSCPAYTFILSPLSRISFFKVSGLFPWSGCSEIKTQPSVHHYQHGTTF